MSWRGSAETSSRVLLPQTAAGPGTDRGRRMVKALGRRWPRARRITRSNHGKRRRRHVRRSDGHRGAGVRRPRHVRGQGDRAESLRDLLDRRGQRERGSARLAEAERIRRALEEDRLLLYCQPILDLRPNEICQYELLLRLPERQGGEPLLPSAFLYVAERFGLIQAIDGWVVRSAIALIAEHARAGRRLVLTSTSRASRSAIPSSRRSSKQALAEAGDRSRPSDLRADRDGGDRQHRGSEDLRHPPARVAAASSPWTTSARGSDPSTTSRTSRSTTSRSTATSSAASTASPMDQLVVEAIVGIAQGMGKKTVAEFVADQETVESASQARRRLRAGLLHRGAAACRGGSRDRVTPHVIVTSEIAASPSGSLCRSLRR